MEADLQYLEYARKLTLYGVDLHEARVMFLTAYIPKYSKQRFCIHDKIYINDACTLHTR